VWDITASDLNLIGHSLGSYLSVEIGGIFAGITSGGREGDDRPVQKHGTSRINRLITLDPAASVNLNFSYDISNNDGAASTKPYDFREVANFSTGAALRSAIGNGVNNLAFDVDGNGQVTGGDIFLIRQGLLLKNNPNVNAILETTFNLFTSELTGPRNTGAEINAFISGVLG
jgi:hypothetical protein